MLAPRTSSAFVCLRCEAQIAPRRPPLVVRRIPCANFSAAARLHQDGAHNQDGPAESEKPKLKIIREVQPLNRVRRRKGKIIKETSASLRGIKQLGDNADILVLREIGDAGGDERTEQPEVIEPARPVQVPDIVASLQQEGKAVIAEEIYQQIGSLRPQNYGDPDEPHYIKQAAFLKLKNVLMNGFTLQQLMTFYSVAKNIEQGHVNQGIIDSLKRDEDNPKRPVERSEWQPGITSLTQRLPGLDHHVKPPSWRKNVSKQLLVDRILRDHWNLVLLEEIEVLGELELVLKPWQAALLTVGENNVLSQIELMRKVQLQIYKHHEILRITADKSTAEYAANDIEEALQRSESKRMNLKNYAHLLEDGVIPKDGKPNLTTLYSQKDLDGIAALTKTAIAATAKNTLTIWGFESAAVDEAKRSLIKLLPLKDAIARTSVMLNMDSAGASPYPAPIYVEKRLLEYPIRNVALGRLSIPLPRTPAPEPADDSQESAVARTSSKKTLEDLVDCTTANILGTARELPQTEELGYWTLEPVNELVARFGQALVPLEQADSKTLARISQNAFVPTFPGLAGFLASSDLSGSVQMQKPTLYYQFRPDSLQAEFDHSQLFPTLQIQMGTNRQGAEAHFRKASIRFWQHAHTVSLPNKAADLQFYRCASLKLRDDHGDTNIQKWVAAAIENIVGGGRITAPRLTIEIPKWTLPGFPSDEKGTATVKYQFSGVEFRQTVSGSLLGEKVSYTARQAGKLASNGCELRAHYSGHGDDQMYDEPSVKVFVERCHAIIDLITNASAHTSPLMKQIRPRHAESTRKARRSEMANTVSAPVDDVDGEALKDLQKRVANYPSVPEDAVVGKTNDMANEVAADEPAAAEAQHGNEGTAPSQPSDMPEAKEADSADSSSTSA